MNTLIKLTIVTILFLPVTGKSQALPKVAPSDLSKLRPDHFSDEELDLPYYLVHFHRIANAVVQTGENRGFIDISVWRSPRDNKPYNARIMENCLSLAYFYCTNRPWNPYYSDPALRRRLEAALSFWCRIQNNDGRFSEYKPGGWGLAPTAFATKFMGETLILLKDGPEIDSNIHKNVIEGMRKAIFIALTDADLYEHGKRYTNQYTNTFAGALAFLSIYPDKEIANLLSKKVRQTHTEFQSPVGYFYERNGPDWGYNLNTHHSNLLMAYSYSNRTPLQKFFVEQEQSFIEWLAYNALLEPDSSIYVLNRSIETRQKHPTIERLGVFLQMEAFLSEEVPLSRAFTQSQSEIQDSIAARRKLLVDNWPRVSELKVGEFSSYSPYAFLNRKHKRRFPTDSQRDAAVARLPYMTSKQFVHQRTDTRKPVSFTYVNRPGYYAAFNSGDIIFSQQRYGIGIIWNRRTGALLQSQTGSHDSAWGTRAKDQPHVYEADSLSAEFIIDGKPVSPQPGNHNLPNGVIAISYPLGRNGKKVVLFEESEIKITITHDGPFTEYIPLLIGNQDRLEIDQGLLSLQTAGKTVNLKIVPAILPTIIETSDSIGEKRIVPVILKGNRNLTYSFCFDPGGKRR